VKYGPNGLEIKEQKKKKSNKYCNDKFDINDNKNNKKNRVKLNTGSSIRLHIKVMIIFIIYNRN